MSINSSIDFETEAEKRNLEFNHSEVVSRSKFSKQLPNLPYCVACKLKNDYSDNISALLFAIDNERINKVSELSNAEFKLMYDKNFPSQDKTIEFDVAGCIEEYNIKLFDFYIFDTRIVEPSGHQFFILERREMFEMFKIIDKNQQDLSTVNLKVNFKRNHSDYLKGWDKIVSFIKAAKKD